MAHEIEAVAAARIKDNAKQVRDMMRIIVQSSGRSRHSINTMCDILDAETQKDGDDFRALAILAIDIGKIRNQLQIINLASADVADTIDLRFMAKS